MRILFACEFTGTVRDEFKKRGHYAVSCDLLPTQKPGLHHQGNVLDIINDGWDMMIGFPPCTYVCRGGLTWIYRDPGRLEKMQQAIEFFKLLLNAPIDKICLENPIGKLNTLVRKPDQICYAYQFGHIYKKNICLWLKNLPPLQHTHVVPGPHKTLDFASQNKNRWKLKVKTFSGLAQAMADQWG